MPVAKIAISMKERTLRQLDRLVKEKAYRTRSEAIEKAVEEKLGRLERSRLARECAKLAPREETALVNLGLEADSAEWPEY